MVIRIRTRLGSPIERILRGPTLARTSDLGRAERSRLTWSLERPGVARLTPLGVLNGLIGLQLVIPDGADG